MEGVFGLLLVSYRIGSDSAGRRWMSRLKLAECRHVPGRHAWHFLNQRLLQSTSVILVVGRELGPFLASWVVDIWRETPIILDGGGSSATCQGMTDGKGRVLGQGCGLGHFICTGS